MAVACTTGAGVEHDVLHHHDSLRAADSFYHAACLAPPDLLSLPNGMLAVGKRATPCLGSCLFGTAHCARAVNIWRM